MKFRILSPLTTWVKTAEIELPDGVDPQTYQLGPGQKLVDPDGIERANGGTVDRALSTLQDMLGDVQDLIQDIRESHEH